MRRVIFIVMILASLFTNASSEDDLYIKRMTSILTRNPDDVDAIVVAGLHFYKKSNYKMAIWYWSSPKVNKSKYFNAVKFYQANSHFKNGETKKARYVLSLVDEEKVSPSIRDEISLLKEQIGPIKNTSRKARSATNITLYKGDVTYSDLVAKNNASVLGVYSMFFHEKLQIEAAYERLSIDFNSESSIETYNQTDYTVMLSSYLKNYTRKLRYGVHINEVDSLLAYSSKSALLGYGKFYSNGNYLGVDSAYNLFTGYGEYDDFYSLQLVPNFKAYLKSWLYISADAYIGKNSYSSEYDADSSVNHSIDFGLGLVFKNLVLSYNFMTGDEQFLLKNKGFLIQNSTDKNIKANVMSAEIKLGDFSVKGKYTINNYKEVGYDETYQNKSAILFVSFNF